MKPEEWCEVYRERCSQLERVVLALVGQQCDHQGTVSKLFETDEGPLSVCVSFHDGSIVIDDFARKETP